MSNDHAHRARQADRENLTYGAQKAELAATEERRRQKEAAMREIQPTAAGQPKKNKGFKKTFVETEALDPETEKKRMGHWKKVGGESSAPQEAETTTVAESSGPVLPPDGPFPVPLDIKKEEDLLPWDSYNFDGVELDFEMYDPQHPIECDEGCPG
jgi:hypothetical protein